MSIMINGEYVNTTRFPDNTTQVWKLPEEWLNEERATIWWDYSHEGELIELAQLKDLLEASGVKRVYLNIGFLPFGRQDKSIANDATFALHSFAKLLNAIEFTEIFIMDPHSTVALALINRSQAVYPHGPVNRAFKMTNSEIVCYPDKGAKDKYQNLYKFEARIYGNKTRDQATGRITGYELHGSCQDRRILIVDDICDGGATFKILAAELYDKGAEDVNLFVTHGLFSQGLKPLLSAGISRIFTNEGEALYRHDVDGVVIRTWERIKTDNAVEFYNS